MYIAHCVTTPTTMVPLCGSIFDFPPKVFSKTYFLQTHKRPKLISTLEYEKLFFPRLRSKYTHFLMSFDTKNVALLGPQIFPLPFLFLLAFKKHTNLTLKGQLHTINFPIFLVGLLVFFSHERSNNIGLPILSFLLLCFFSSFFIVNLFSLP